jgi:RNA polymerase sigma-70 factor (ECF subfamily)
MSDAAGGTMRDAPTDDVLLREAKVDRGAFAALFERHAVPIFRFAAHRVGAGSAEDVLAETFARAFAARERAFTTEGSLRAWLYTIAANLVADELRRQERASRAQWRLVNRVTPEASEVGVATDQALLSALEQLPAEQREALLLLAWGELSYAEIAVVTGVAIGTVRSRLNRARSHVRAALDASASEVAR